MTRSVAALYDTRAEAEIARARLSAQVDAEQVQIFAKDDVAQLDRVPISAEEARSYRQALSEGSFLLIAHVASGEDTERIVSLLKQAAAAGGTEHQPIPQHANSAPSAGAVVDEVRVPQLQEELRIGKREVVQGGARVRTVTRERAVEEHVSLREEQLQAETRPAGRQLTLDDVQAAGLLKNRVIEVSAMREEPVITKEAVVREEVVLKKTISERVEAIHETVRYTEVAVDDLPGDRPTARPSASAPPPSSPPRR